MLYPGQVLYVPDPSYVPPPVEPKSPPLVPVTDTNIPSPSKTTSPLTSPTKHGEVQHFKWKPNIAPKPGHIELITSAAPSKTEEPNTRRKSQNMRHTLSEDEAKRLDDECTQRFLKINSKIITYSKGIIDGVLLVTPSAVMFDPIINSNDANKKSEHTGRTSNGGEPRHSNADESESIIIPIEMISNVILYEDLSLRDIQDYFELR
jgi:hypothetical protein